MYKLFELKTNKQINILPKFLYNIIKSEAVCTLVCFRFKMHNFSYGYACRLRRPRFSLKTLGLCFCVNGPKLRISKMMDWLPTFVLRILDDLVRRFSETQ